ncbi:hypothetical protein AB8O38_04140 [Saccharomonospora xinjiangensis]|uniref:hypothetical protein n=1 Tax=Saccharomonospora xinjiangensis TaxID=75294 RepID=UPI00350F8CB2
MSSRIVTRDGVSLAVVVRYDLCGHGESDPPETTTIDRSADEIVALCPASSPVAAG